MFFIFHYLKLEKFETIDFNKKGAYAKKKRKIQKLVFDPFVIITI